MRLLCSTFLPSILWLSRIEFELGCAYNCIHGHFSKYLERTNFRVYLFSRAKKNRISRVFIFANKFLKISSV